jgi:predicted dehydrogenase
VHVTEDDRPGEQRPLRVAQIGYAFMGATHSHAWRTAPRVFDLPRTPELTVLCGRTADATRAAADKLGWSEWATDWRELVERRDIDVVDVCTPGDSHAEIAIAALEAGKHVLCEKPLGNTLAEAETMTAAAEAAAQRGVRSMVAFNYRRLPALSLAQQMIASGRSTCRTGSSTPSSRWPGGCRRTRPGRARSATSARTSSTSPSS